MRVVGVDTACSSYYMLSWFLSIFCLFELVDGVGGVWETPLCITYCLSDVYAAFPPAMVSFLTLAQASYNCP